MSVFIPLRFCYFARFLSNKFHLIAKMYFVLFISTSLLEAMPNSFTETSKLNLCHNHIKFVAMYREAKLVIFHVHKLIVFFKVLILHNSSLNTVDLTMF